MGMAILQLRGPRSGGEREGGLAWVCPHFVFPLLHSWGGFGGTWWFRQLGQMVLKFELFVPDAPHPLTCPEQEAHLPGPREFPIIL